MMSKWFVATLAVALMGSSVAVSGLKGAEEKKKPEPEEQFKKRDKDADGFLTWDEFKGKLEGEKLDAAKKQFEAKDANKDMKLSLEEFKAKVKTPK